MSAEIKLTDDYVLNDGQQIKTDIINHIKANGVASLGDERLEMLLKFVESRDKVALGRLKIESAAETSGAIAMAQATIAEMFKRAGQNGSAKPYVEMEPTERELPTAGADIPVPIPVLGETEVAPKQITFESFQELMGVDIGDVSEGEEEEDEEE